MPRKPPGESVWFRDEAGPRRPRLSRERIVEAAIALLDAEGVDGFSMRRLAARLNAGTMSLYEYVTGREDVLDLALDTVMAEIELDASPDARWRDTLIGQLTQSRQVVRRHPWVPVLIGTRPLLGPNALARSERFYTALVRAGLDGPRLLAAVGALTFFANGYVAAENTWRTWIRDPSDETELRRKAQAHVEKRPDLYPTLSQHAQLDDGDFDGQFALALQMILDGIEAQLDTPSPKA